MGKEHQRTYWKSLNELAQNEEYQKFVEREFPGGPELNDGVSRRNFLQVMGASIALAGLASCRKPVQKIMPYTRQPEEVVAGEPLYYATSMPFKDYVTGMLVETHDGRPTKVEGNEDHPNNRGKSNSFNQAATLEMYDQDRARFIRRGGERASWQDFVNFCSEHFADTDRNIAFITEATSSPTYHRLKDQVRERFPNADWVTFEPHNEENRLEGVRKAFGQRLRSFNAFDEADVVFSLDDDFMLMDENSVENVRRYSNRRKVSSTDDEMNRLYVAESSYSITGSNADHRLRLKAGESARFLYALAAELSGRTGGLEAFSGYSNEFSDHQWIQVLADDLMASQGRSIVTAGAHFDSDVHAAVAAINLALDNAGNTVRYMELPFDEEVHQDARFADVVENMRGGQYDTVVIVGANPAFNAPADLDFAGALEQAGTRLHLSLHYNETSRLCDWHVHRAHFLEAWGDGYSYTGVRSVIQPMIQPLFDGKSEIEFLNAAVNGEDESGHELVRSTWQEFFPANFEDNWQRTLHDGLVEDTAFDEPQVSLTGDFNGHVQQALQNLPQVNQEDIEVVIKPDPSVYDGRYANNGWLQELPEPMTKITWDNVALMNPVTARNLGIRDNNPFGVVEHPVIRITTGQGEVDIPAWILPGHADNCITVTTGYGRSGIGSVADGVGTDTYVLRTTDHMLYHSSVDVADTGRMYEIASTQDHHSLEGRPLIREATMEEYRDQPTFAPDEVYIPGRPEGYDDPVTLFAEQEFPDREPQWGMSIDLNSCIGCGACTIACQAENNIPVIGKREVRNGREMHWIRTDRYFSGDVDGNPEVVHQPVPCMHCELAPCEQVCPVSATTHSEDGLNQMTYNQCVGTRYCSNNCPFKVRRFNFFNYADEYLTTGDDPEVVQMAMNPDVTIRFRGVMEKCTYCVQRIQREKIKTKNRTGDSVKPPDGSVVTACQQACPADAIEFGDISDPESRISIAKNNERSYLMLEELNVRPRTSYMAKLRNPNPALS